MSIPDRCSIQPESGIATTTATTACAPAAPRMPPACAPTHRAGSRAASHARFSQTDTRVLPRPVWTSKTSAVSIRATITNARKRSAWADGAHSAPYKTWIMAGASTAITVAIGGDHPDHQGQAALHTEGHLLLLALGKP